MLHLGLLLVIGGIAGVLRKHMDNKIQRLELSVPVLDNGHQENTKHLPQKVSPIYDDVGELYHSQQVSNYTLALTAAGAWFYVPVVTLISIPLLGYSAYHFTHIIRHSNATDRKKPLVIFEAIGISASLLTGQLLSASLIFFFSFGVRKLLLQAGNISNNIPLSHSTDLNFKRVWILREGAELETTISELQTDDIIAVHPGDMVKVKGKIIQGDGILRQFSLRKQMKSVPKTVGDKVFPYTLLESGSFHIQVVT
jgi:cation transport ATPase